MKRYTVYLTNGKEINIIAETAEYKVFGNQYFLVYKNDKGEVKATFNANNIAGDIISE